MYNFERRLKNVLMEFNLMIKAKDNFNIAKFEHHFNNCIILARSITWVMRKDLSKQSNFEVWYDQKILEMTQKGFKHFITKRNLLEKEGGSVAMRTKVEINVMGFFKKPGYKKVGTYMFPDGTKKTSYGTLKNTFFFDKDNNEAIKSLKEYIDYLEILTIEAKDTFFIK